MRRVTPKTAESDLQRESDQLCQVLLETAQTHKYKYCQSNFFYLENCTNSQIQIQIRASLPKFIWKTTQRQIHFEIQFSA